MNIKFYNSILSCLFMELESKEVESVYKATVDDSGKVVLKKKSKIRRGSKARATGSNFELKVRKDLQRKDWTVDKWSNNVDLENEALHPAKRKYNPFSKVMAIGTGFPDFICFQKIGKLYKIIGVEVKINGSLSKIEKNKCKFYLKNKIFNEILVAKKKKIGKKIFVEYINFLEIEKRMR